MNSQQLAPHNLLCMFRDRSSDAGALMMPHLVRNKRVYWKKSCMTIFLASYLRPNSASNILLGGGDIHDKMHDLDSDSKGSDSVGCTPSCMDVNYWVRYLPECLYPSTSHIKAVRSSHSPRLPYTSPLLTLYWQSPTQHLFLCHQTHLICIMYHIGSTWSHWSNVSALALFFGGL